MPSFLQPNCQELLRYSRQIPLIGNEGQIKLKNAKVLCIGVGGLGCPSALNLAAVGVGRIGIVDGDKVEIHNLHRQVLFTDEDVGMNKAECAKRHLKSHQPEISIQTYPVYLNTENAAEIINNYDIILDGTDNYNSRYVINYFCKKLNKPLVSASIFRFDAQIGVFNYHNGPCYQCLYPAPPPSEFIPNCGEAGVLGVLSGLAGTLQASEAIKIILNLNEVTTHEFLCFNLLSMEFRKYPMFLNSECPACQGIFPKLSEETHCLNHLEKLRVDSSGNEEPGLSITPSELKLWLALKKNICLVDVRQPHEHELYNIGGLLIPLQNLDEQAYRLPKDKPIVCYCKMGPRSFAAVQKLKDKGFTSLHVLEGGVVNWRIQLDPQGASS